MKKLTLIIAALMAAATLTGCGGGDTSTASDSSVSDAAQVKSISDKTAEVIAKVDMPDMAEVTPDKLTIYYKINEEDITEYSAYVAGAGAYPDEIGIFVAVSEDKAQEISDKLDERIQKQMNTYRDYSPDEMYKFDDSVVKIVDGTTVVFSVCADNATAEDILSE